MIIVILNLMLLIAELMSAILAFVSTIQGNLVRATFFYAVAIYCHLKRKDD